MIRLTHVVLLALFGGIAPAAASSAPPVAARQEPLPDPDEVADKRAEVLALCDRFDAHVARRGAEDAQAIEVLDLLLAEFPRSGPKDRAAIVKTVSGGLEARRSAEEVLEEDEAREKANNQLYLACAVGLGEMGPESVPELLGWIGHKRHRRDLELQRRLVLSLGKTRDPKGVRPLTDLLTHKDAVLVAAAAEALAQHENAPEETRKKIFAELLEVLMAAKGAMDSDVNDTIARERYNTFSAAIVTSLGRLSGHDERDPDAWQRWWNKNKREEWGPERS
jgi:HEAT repeat protein